MLKKFARYKCQNRKEQMFGVARNFFIISIFEFIKNELILLF